MARILVVEDERIVAKDIQRCLVQRGHDVPVVASSAEEAITAAGLVRPDLVLMDVTLKAPLDGINCAAVLRDRHQIPVVYLTAHGDQATLEQARATGPVGYVLKPYQDETLFAAIEVALQRIAIDRRLRGRESWLTAVLGSIVDGVVTIGPEGLVTLLNPAGCRMTGFAESDAVGKDFSDVIRVRDNADSRRLADQVREMLSGMCGGGDPLSCTLLGPEGSEIPVECAVTPICGNTAPVAGAVVVMRDVTDRKRADQALSASEQKYRSLFENAVVGFIRSTPDGALLAANPVLANLLGFQSVEDLMGMGGVDLKTVYVDPLVRGRMIARLQKEGSVTEFEAEYRRRDGTSGWFSANFRGVKDTAGNLQSIEGTVMDITVRKRAKEGLESREAYLRAILDNAPFVIWLKDIEGRYIDLNRSLARKCGFDSIESMRGKNDFEIYPPAEAARLRNQDVEIMRTGSRIVLEEGYDESGKRHYTEKYKGVLSDASNNVLGTVGFSRDITEMKEQEIRLRKLSRAVEQSSSTIVITDTSGNIEYVNPRFTKLTGYTPEEVIGKTPGILKSGNTPRQEYERLWQTISAGGEWSGELQNRKKNGDLFWENVTISPIRDENGVITHYVGIKEDITKRKEVEAELARRADDLLRAKSQAEEQARRLGVQAFELRKAREEALKASRLKSEFVANMSHEIRTPMNGVLGMTGLLLDTALDEEQREFAGIIRTSGEVLLAIVNDILDFSKIEAGKMDLEEIDFELRATLEESMDLVSARAREKGLELCCDIGDGVPPDLRGDPGRVRQILTNLLANAVKFTERGEVEAGVTCLSRIGDNVTLRFSVRDTGIGISDEERSRLFRPFSQADGSTTRKHGGTGLGLVIAKQLAGLMKGEIGVRSEKGKGSEFWFTVNMALCPSPLPSDEPIQSVPVVPGLEKSRCIKRVLVAEDNPVNQRVAVKMLEKIGCRADVVADGKEALDAVSRVPYDLVFMDCQMPEMDGFEATTRIRKLTGRPGKTLIVAMTANALRGDRERCIACGMNDYLPKPIMQEALESLLAKWESLEVSSGQENVRAAPVRAPDQEESFEREKLAELKELAIGAEPEWLETLIRQFLQDSADRLEKLRSAYKNGEKREIEEVAHALKGSSGTMGASEMRRIAERLQHLGRAGSLEGVEPLIDDLERELGSTGRYLEGVLVERENPR